MKNLMKRVIEDIFVAVTPVGRGCNSSFIVTTAGIVMIDTPWYPSDAVKWRDIIAQKGAIQYIINTEYHTDHISGNYFFEGTVVSHAGVRTMFTAPLDQFIPTTEGIEWAKQGLFDDVKGYILYRFKTLDPAGISFTADYEPKPPVITFTERLTLYVGNRTFELMHLPGHTPYQVAVYIPEEKVIFTGDNVTNGTQPSLTQCCPMEWIESLQKIESMDIEIVVPGHGSIGDKKMVRETLEYVREYVDTVQRAINRGMTMEEAANAISFETPHLVAQHPGSDQQRSNVLRLYEVLAKRGNSF
jgi:cyclase